MQNDIEPIDADVIVEDYTGGILVDFKSPKAREWTIDNVIDNGATWINNDKLFIPKEFIEHFKFFVYDEDFEMYDLTETK